MNIWWRIKLLAKRRGNGEISRPPRHNITVYRPCGLPLCCPERPLSWIKYGRLLIRFDWSVCAHWLVVWLHTSFLCFRLFLCFGVVVVVFVDAPVCNWAGVSTHYHSFLSLLAPFLSFFLSFCSHSIRRRAGPWGTIVWAAVEDKQDCRHHTQELPGQHLRLQQSFTDMQRYPPRNLHECTDAYRHK